MLTAKRDIHRLGHKVFRAVEALLIVLMLVVGPSQLIQPAAASAAAGPSTPAPGGPGALSYFDLARKDCVGTSQTTASKVWFTVAGGILSDVLYPTIDNTNVKSLQYIITDGSTFTDLQERDM
jgi:glucoamylase